MYDIIPTLKLQQRPNRTVGTKKYVKNYVDLSPHLIHEAGWRKGDKINATVKGHNIILKRKG